MARLQSSPVQLSLSAGLNTWTDCGSLPVAPCALRRALMLAASSACAAEPARSCDSVGSCSNTHTKAAQHSGRIDNSAASGCESVVAQRLYSTAHLKLVLTATKSNKQNGWQSIVPSCRLPMLARQWSAVSGPAGQTSFPTVPPLNPKATGLGAGTGQPTIRESPGPPLIVERMSLYCRHRIDWTPSEK